MTKVRELIDLLNTLDDDLEVWIASLGYVERFEDHSLEYFDAYGYMAETPDSQAPNAVILWP